jgi:putative nucleotidyltransferase with HDIG domain
MKPIFFVVGHQTMWDHSLEAAAVAQKLSSNSKRFDASSAYILGLLHDVGELLLGLTSNEARATLQTLVAGGCERGVAELMAFGATHGQAGADVLRHWRMPEEYVKAVEYHHDPECGGGPGSALLYLAEQWTEPNGDRLHDDRLEHSLDVMQLQEVMPYKWQPAART